MTFQRKLQVSKWKLHFLWLKEHGLWSASSLLSVAMLRKWLGGRCIFAVVMRLHIRNTANAMAMMAQRKYIKWWVTFVMVSTLKSKLKGESSVASIWVFFVRLGTSSLDACRQCCEAVPFLANSELLKYRRLRLSAWKLFVIYLKNFIKGCEKFKIRKVGSVPKLKLRLRAAPTTQE